MRRVPVSAETLLPVFACALGGQLLGAVLLRLVGRQDHRTWVLARAPGLPVRVLAVGDDAWVRGVVRSDAPLVCPHFEQPCVAFAYRREREHHWTTKDKDGETQHHSEWRTEHSEGSAIDFVLDDGDPVVVRARGADNEALRGLATDYESSRLRHVASVVEVGAELSVLGVVQDDRSLAAQREVPCLWTRLPRERRVRRSASHETVLAVLAWCAGALGGGGAMAFALVPVPMDPIARWLAILTAALAGVLPLWSVGVHNRFVRLRQQVTAAFRQVDVDLAVRAALVPALVEVVRAHAAHERALLTALAAIRRGSDPRTAAAGEAAACRATRAVLTLHERAPELRADALYRDLHERLWAVEEKLAHTRSLYNDIASEWNTRLARLPEGLMARLMRSRPAPLLDGGDAPLPPRLRD
jgi:LemA protein